MKSLLLSTLALSLLSLAACQSSTVSTADSRTLELSGLQGRTTVELPASDATAMNTAPYALQGNSDTGTAASPTGLGYQAR